MKPLYKRISDSFKIRPHPDSSDYAYMQTRDGEIASRKYDAERALITGHKLVWEVWCIIRSYCIRFHASGAIAILTLIGTGLASGHALHKDLFFVFCIFITGLVFAMLSMLLHAIHMSYERYAMSSMAFDSDYGYDPPEAILWLADACNAYTLFWSAWGLCEGLVLVHSLVHG